MDPITDYLATNPSFTEAVVCFLVRDDQVLLGRRKKSSWGLGENLFSGIGGKVADLPEIADETADEALIRELQEEIGIELTRYKPMGEVTFLFPNKPKWNQIVKIYIGTEWQGEPVETESIAPTWFEMDKLPVDNMWKDNRFWLPEVLNGKPVNHTYLYKDTDQSELLWRDNL